MKQTEKNTITALAVGTILVLALGYSVGWLGGWWWLLIWLASCGGVLGKLNEASAHTAILEKENTVVPAPKLTDKTSGRTPLWLKALRVVVGVTAVLLLGLFIFASVIDDKTMGSPTDSASRRKVSAEPESVQDVNVFDTSKKSHDLLHSKSKEQQIMALAVAVSGSEYGDSCRVATAGEPFFMGVDSDSAAYWNITCGDKDFIVQLSADTDGSTRVIPCEIASLIGITCYEKF